MVPVVLTCLPFNNQSTNTRGGKVGGTGWGLAVLVSKKSDQKFLPSKHALLHPRSLKLKTWSEWRQLSKSGERSVNILAGPDINHKHEGWHG